VAEAAGADPLRRGGATRSGGLVAIELAVRRPDAVTRLVVASAPALGLPAQMRQFLENPAADWGDGVDVAAARGPAAVRQLVRRYFEWLWVEQGTLCERHVDIYEEALRAEGVWQGMLEAGRAVASWRLPSMRCGARRFRPRAVGRERPAGAVAAWRAPGDLAAGFVQRAARHRPLRAEQRPLEILKALE